MNRQAAWTAVVACAIAAGCDTFQTVKTGPDGKPVSGLMNSEREIRSFIGRARDPREFAVTITLNSDGAPVIVNANRCRTGLEAVSSFVSPPHTALPVLDGAVNGREARILVDSTSSANWTSIERAKAYGLIALAPPLIGGLPQHVVDQVRGTLCVAPSMALDVLPIDSALFYARASRGPLWPLSRSADAHDADFVIGWSLLRAFQTVRWDFVGRVISFSTRPYAADDDRLLARVQLEKDFDALVVKGMIEGKTKPILIDLAGDYEIALDESTMDLMKQVSLGDLVLRDLHPTTLETHGLGYSGVPHIGLRALSKYRLILDNRRNELLIEAPTAAATRAAP